jgi:ribose/xylose/arabinose/galactoside ABC-type transport system permease subunit
MARDQRQIVESHNWLRQILSGPGAGVAVFLVVVCVPMSFVSPNFATWLNFRNVLNQSVFTMILAVGMTAVLIGGGIDLSVGAVVGLSAGVVAWLIKAADFPLALALFSGLVVGTCIGLANALIILRLKIPDFIATLAMLGFASGILYVWTNGVPFIGYAGPDYMLIGGLGRWFWWITVPEVVAMLVIVVLAILVNASRFGRHLRASGENADVARLSGVNVVRVKVRAYALSGFLAALVGVLLAGRLTTVQPNLGLGMELNALAAAIMGGAALSGGRGSILGAVLGALTLTVIQNVINLLGVQPAWETFCVGCIILLVTVLSRLSNLAGEFASPKTAA